MNRINLSKYNLRTDLIIEKDDAIHNKKIIDGIEVTSSYQNGNYITITFEDITNFEDREKIGKILENILKDIYSKNNIQENEECLIIGLGNIKSTPDSLGVKVIDDIDNFGYPTTRDASGVDPVFVGRIRKNLGFVNGISLWCVADNLRIGAALNTVRICKKVTEMGLYGKR
jgi:aspartate-semialdehyde dehydrogenase